MRPSRHRRARQGAIIPLVALLLIPLLAMMAFSVDIGYSVAARAELVNASDAAALAGAQQLYAPYWQWQSATGSAKTTYYNNAIACAKASAVAVAGVNRAGGVLLQLSTSDVDVGYTDANGNYYSGNQGLIPAGKFPNTVSVTCRRDNTNLPSSNGEVPMFFGPVIGKSSMALTATASAAAYEGMVTSFQSIAGVNGILLPIAVDQTQWTDFYKNGASSVDADPNAPAGQAWLQIYPGGTGSSMDGLLSLNGSKAASQTYYSGGPPGGGWVQSGPTSADISGLLSAGDLPLPTSGAGETWASGPGMKSSLLSDFQADVTAGGVRLLPLFDPSSSGTTGGGNGTYQVTYFVPVTMVYAQGHGKANMDIAVIAVQGTPITDPTAVVSNVAPLGTSTTPAQYVVAVAAKLTK